MTRRTPPARTIIRVVLRLAAALALVAISLLAIHRAFLPLLGWLFPSIQGTLYDLAVYGIYPSREFRTFPLQVPTPEFVQWSDECDDGGLVFLSPYGGAVEPARGPMILDASGRLVWLTDRWNEEGAVMNLRVQSWKGEDYLTIVS